MIEILVKKLRRLRVYEKGGLSCPDSSALGGRRGRESGLGLFTCFFRHWCAQVL